MKNILVVDDYSTNAIMVKQALPEQIYSVKMVTSGEQALNSLKTRHEDLILLDILMPEMDGVETLKKIRKNPDTKDIPVIFLTGQADKNRIIDGISLGIVDIIVKPIIAKTVLERIERALRGDGPGQFSNRQEVEKDNYDEVELENDEDETEESECENITDEEDYDEGIW